MSASMLSLMISPAAQAAFAATACRLPGSYARCVIDQKAGVNAAPQRVLIKREAIMAGMNLMFSLMTQAALSLPVAKVLTKTQAWGKYETLIRAAFTLPGMLLTEYLSRKGAYADLEHVPSQTAQMPHKSSQNPIAMSAMAIAAPMLLNVVSPAEFGSLSMPTATAQARHPQFNGPLYY